MKIDIAAPRDTPTKVPITKGESPSDSLHALQLDAIDLRPKEPPRDVHLAAAATSDGATAPTRDLPPNWQVLSPVQQADWLLEHPSGPQLSPADNQLFADAITHADAAPKDPTPVKPSPRLTQLLHDQAKQIDALNQSGVDTDALRGLSPSTLDETDGKAHDLIARTGKVPAEKQSQAFNLYLEYRTATSISELGDVRKRLTDITPGFAPILDEVDSKFQWKIPGPTTAKAEAFKLNQINRDIEKEEHPKIYTRLDYVAALSHQASVGDADTALAQQLYRDADRLSNSGANDAGASPTAAASAPDATPTAWDKLDADLNSRAQARDNAEKLWNDAETAANDKEKNPGIDKLKPMFEDALDAEEKALGNRAESAADMRATMAEIEAGEVTNADGTKRKLSAEELINRHVDIVNNISEIQELVNHHEQYAQILSQNNQQADAQHQVALASKALDSIPTDDVIREIKLLSTAAQDKNFASIAIPVSNGSTESANQFFENSAAILRTDVASQFDLAMLKANVFLDGTKPNDKGSGSHTGDANGSIEALKPQFDAALAAEERASAIPADSLPRMQTMLKEIRAGEVQAPDGTKHEMSNQELIDRHQAIINTIASVKTLVTHREQYADLLRQNYQWADVQKQLDFAKDSDRLPLGDIVQESELLHIAQGIQALDVPPPGGANQTYSQYFREAANEFETYAHNQVVVAMNTTDFNLGSFLPILPSPDSPNEFNIFPGFGTTTVSKPDLAQQSLERAEALKHQIGDLMPYNTFQDAYHDREEQIRAVSTDTKQRQIQSTRDSYNRSFAEYISLGVGMAAHMLLDAWGKPELAAAVDDTAAANAKATGLLATAARFGNTYAKPVLTYRVDSVPLLGSVPLAPLSIGGGTAFATDLGIRKLETNNPDQVRDSAIEALTSYTALAAMGRFYPYLRAKEVSWPPWKAFGRGDGVLAGLKRANDWGGFAAVAGTDAIHTGANVLVDHLHGQNWSAQIFPDLSDPLNPNALIPRIFTYDLVSSRALEPLSPPSKPGWLGWRSGMYRLNPDKPLGEMTFTQKAITLNWWNAIGSQMEIPVGGGITSNFHVPGFGPPTIPILEEQIRRNEQPTVNEVPPKPN